MFLHSVISAWLAPKVSPEPEDRQSLLVHNLKGAALPK